MQEGKHVILCIDDDPDIRESLRVILSASGYVVEQAASAEEGVRVYRRQRPDLIIVDLMMEEIDAGTSFVTQIRALGEPVPIYMLSSTGDALRQTTSYADLGLAGVLQKPVDSRTLLSLLREKLVG
ncbi:MAG: response regulator [bacterium]|nr:response regulator [bacterium]